MTQLARRYFGTDGIRGRANAFPLVPEFVTRLGRAAATVLLAGRADPRAWPTVIIGKDTRQSCDMLESAIAAGLTSQGIDVRLAGVVPTPAVAQLTREERAAFGIVISASHNPFEDNGIKFFGPDGYKLDDTAELEIESLLDNEGALPPGGPVGRIADLPHAAERYIAAIRASVGDDGGLLRGLHIALDTANGASSVTSAEILHSLGAKVSAIHHHPNGININAGCGCTHPEVIGAFVRECGTVVGVAHDGDADRVLLCDETGSILDGDEILAIAALAMLREDRLAGRTLVATVMSNTGLDEAIRAAGGQVIRAGVGDRYVIEAMRKGGYNLGGEQSGHFIFHDYNTTGDGILAAVQVLKILRESGQALSELRQVMRKFPQAHRNIRIREKRPLDALAASAQILRLEQALGQQGRVLLRYSGTEPLLRLLIEGPDADLIAAEADAISAAIHSEIGA